MNRLTTIGKLLSLLLIFGMAAIGLGQETTGSLQGTVKDSTGAVVINANVSVTTPTLVGVKTVETDSKGYYHFSNLPPGAYVVSVDAKGFQSLKQAGLVIQVGHSPSLDLTLSVGSESTVVEVTTASPQIDVTTTQTQTNVTQDVANYIPHGTSYQSVIQFAPAARQEPLMGNTALGNGTGGTSPGNGANGSQYGYSVAGGSDSENSYLVEGQETANLIGGYSFTKVPSDFIQEVTIKTSGVVAQYGGALGAVVNAVMMKGTSQYHGAVFGQFENQAMDASPSAITRYDPTSAQTLQAGWHSAGLATYKGFTDAALQSYLPKKSHTSDLFFGFRLGGPLLPFSGWRDKAYFFIAADPELQRVERFIDYSSASNASQTVDKTLGVVPFSRNTNTYYGNARIDAQVTKKIRVFGSWLYQLQRQNGESMPGSDSAIAGQPNISTGNTPSKYAHTAGYDAPNITLNTGADIALTSSIVSTTRFGYYFENYHDFGYPLGGAEYQFQDSGIGQTDGTGAALPPSLAVGTGSQNSAINSNDTLFNSNKAIQLDQNVAFYKSGWAGTHNFVAGYQLNRLSNYILQGFNQPYFQVFVGNGGAADYSPTTDLGNTYCSNPANLYGGSCQGRYGYILVYDAGTGGKATSYNHSIFAQDSWTVGHGLTLDLGFRIEKEFLPGEGQAGGGTPKPIDFSWSDKFSPRVGAAWDVLGNGKAKLFGSYGVYYDIMKLNLAISSFGGQYWNTCAYALNTSDLGSITPAFDANNRYCSGFVDTGLANFSSAGTPAGLTFIENTNMRAWPTTCSTCSQSQEGVAPGLKPYRQHEAVFGFDYQLAPRVAFEVRYDRRRLDHVIEDASIYNSTLGETFVIVNPGQGTNASFEGFCNFLYPGSPNCTSSSGYPPDINIPASRSYDGVEFRLNKGISNHWSGMLSYTYSKFRGNYTGLTSSDQADANGGRNSPNNSRAFDEPYFQYNAYGGSSSGPLPTDRPNTLKGYAYYQLGFKKKFTTNFGIFQTMYQGSPNSTLIDTGAGGQGWMVYPFNRGVWADITQSPTTGVITVGTPRTYRNPWYNQTDFQMQQSYKISESKSITVSGTLTNLLNQHKITSVDEFVDSEYSSNYLRPGNLNVTGNVPFYAGAEHAYNVNNLINGTVFRSNNKSGPLTINSRYGQPNTYQLPRTIRVAATFTF